MKYEIRSEGEYKAAISRRETLRNKAECYELMIHELQRRLEDISTCLARNEAAITVYELQVESQQKRK